MRIQIGARRFKGRLGGQMYSLIQVFRFLTILLTQSLIPFQSGIILETWGNDYGNIQDPDLGFCIVAKLK